MVFDKVAVIQKDREVFVKNNMVLVRDRVDGLGDFVELWAPLSVDLNTEAAGLGLRLERMVPETYIRLFLKNQAKT